MCLLRYVGCLADLGVRALKLEGRTKSGGYVAQIADVYRTALDRHARREAGGPDCGKVEISTAALLEELFHTASRPLSTGFFLPRRRVEAPPARGGAACGTGGRRLEGAGAFPVVIGS